MYHSLKTPVLKHLHNVSSFSFTLGVVNSPEANSRTQFKLYLVHENIEVNILNIARRASSDDSMSSSGSAGLGFDPRRGSKFNLGAKRGGNLHFLIARLYITGLD